ncbi:MAG TPA: response regulator transcription factor [Propionibacteriaceae bacterium]|nr:response regulator transcription factor [Propionibacteriaceae bacterium]
MIRVVLVDDHPVVRAGVRALIEGQDDITVVGEAADAASAREVVKASKPAVVLMDLNLGEGHSGADATRELRSLPDAPYVLVLTTYDTEADILAAINAGASGYLLKDADPDALYRAIRGTASGETMLAPAIASRLVRRASAPSPVLSPRELQILELLADGLTNKEMARRLFVSEATVKSHLSHIYASLGVDTRAGAVAKAIELRIIRS